MKDEILEKLLVIVTVKIFLSWKVLAIMLEVESLPKYVDVVHLNAVFVFGFASAEIRHG